MRVPVGPPAIPVAITGWPRARSARATFTPLPPAIAVCSTERWRLPEPEVRHGERLVDGGVEGDGDDHLTIRRRTRRGRNTSSVAASRMASAANKVKGTPSTGMERALSVPASGTARRRNQWHAAHDHGRPPARSHCPPERPPAGGAVGPRRAPHTVGGSAPRLGRSQSRRGPARSARAPRRGTRSTRSRERGGGRGGRTRWKRARPQRSSSSVSSSRACSLGSPRHDAHHLHRLPCRSSRRPARNRHSGVWPVLTPLAQQYDGDQGVAVVHGARARARLELRGGHVDDPGKAGPPQPKNGERGEVGRGVE